MKKIVIISLFLLSLVEAESIEKIFYKTTCELGKSSINISACNKLAKLYYSPKYEKDLDYKEAKKYFSMACEGNSLDACYQLSAIYYQGLGVDKNFTIGHQFSLKACDLGSADACHSVGYIMYNLGLTIDRVDKIKAVTYLQKACQKNTSSSCMQLADIYSNKNLKKYYNLNKANKFYKKAIKSFEYRCQHKDSFSCGYLGEIYYLGNYKKADYSKAEDYFKKECEYNNENGGCLHLGYMTYYSKDKNLTKTLSLVQEACDLKFGLACSIMGDIYLEKGDKKRANIFYDKAIVGYMELADGYNILTDFHKIFEISLIQDKEFDNKLVEKFFRLYQEHESYLINYKIIKLFEEIYHKKEPNVDAFIEKYRGITLYKGELGYDFPHLKVWIDTMDDKEMKEKLLDAYEKIKKEYNLW